MKNSTENADKNVRKQAKMVKHRKDAGTCRDKNEKITQEMTPKISNWKSIWNTWILLQEIHLLSRQTSTRNKEIPTRSTLIRMDDQRKDQIDPNGPA